MRVTAKNKNIEFTNNIATGSGTKEGYGIYLTAYTSSYGEVSSVLELNANSGKKITINDTIYSKNVGCPDDGKVVINNDHNYNSGTVIFNNKFDIDRMEIYGGTTVLGTGTAATSLTKAQYLEVYGGTLSFANNNIDTLSFANTINNLDAFNLVIDVDAGETVTADKITADLDNTNYVYLSALNFMNDSAESGEVQIADGSLMYLIDFAPDIYTGHYTTYTYANSTGVLTFADPVSWYKPTFGIDSSYRWTQTNTGLVPTVYKPGIDEEKTFYLSIQKKTYVDANGDEQTLTYSWNTDTHKLTVTKSGIAVKTDGVEYVGNTGKNGGALLNPGNVSGWFGGNSADYGGALFIQDTPSNTINAHFIGNQATGSGDGYGGAIYTENTIGSIVGDFIGNSGWFGGAIYSYQAAINSVKGDFIGNSVSATNGHPNGGAIFLQNNASITTIEGNFVGNTAITNSEGYYALGGAIANRGGSNISTINADFVGNLASAPGNYANGGAIYNDGESSISLINGEFRNNSADMGGAIYNGVSSTITKITGKFVGNSVSAGSNDYSVGGAIANANNAHIGEIEADFTNNSAKDSSCDQGGAIFVGLYSTIDSITGNFVGNTAKNNSGDGYGGAIYTLSSTINTLTGNFENNTADWGGAIYNEQYVGTETKTLIGNLIGNFTNNSASFGGAILNNSGVIPQLTGNFENNSATRGGAIFNRGTFNAITGDFIGNSATLDELSGGAIYNTGSGTINLYDSSFRNNKGIEGAAIFVNSGAVSVTAKTKDIEFTNNNTTGTAEGTGTGIHIVNGVFNLNAASGKKITINDNVYLGGTLGINTGDENNSGTITFNGDIGTNYGKAEFGGGNIKFAKSTSGLNFETLTVSRDTTLDLQNNSAGEGIYAYALGGTGNLTFNVDYDASNGHMDYIYAIGGAGTVTLNAIKVLADGKATSAQYLYFDGSPENINVIDSAIVAQTADYRYTFTPDTAVKGRLNVTRTAFEATLADAIADATVSSYTMGSDFTFDENGQGTLAGEGRNFTIFGQDHVIDGGGTYSYIRTSAGQTLSIENVTFQNISPAIRNQGNLNLKNVSFATQDYTDITNDGILNLDGTNTVNHISWYDDGTRVVNVNSGTTTVRQAIYYQNELNVAEGATLILGNDYSSIQTAFDNKGTLQIDYQLNVYSGNMTNSGTISGDGRIVVGGVDSEAYLENTGTINNLLVAKNGTVKTAVENVTGTINNRGTLLLSGTLNKNIYKGNTTALKEGVIKIDGTLKIDASGAGDKTIYTSSIIDPNGGTIDMKNNQIDTLWVSSNKTTGTGNLTLDVDLSGETVKSDVFYATGSGSGSTNNDVLTVTDLGIIGELKPFEAQILQGDVYCRSLLLSDAVAAKYNKTEISTRYESDDLTATASWDDTFNSKKYETETIKKLETYAADSYTSYHQGLRYTETTGEETLVEETPLGDTLSLLNQTTQFGDTEREFVTSDANAVHNVTADLGTTAAGKFTVKGATDGSNTSTIDLKGKDGFKISDGAEVVLDTVKLVGAKAEDGALIDNESGSVTLKDVEVAENSKPTINNDSAMKLSGTNNIDSGIGGNGTTNITDGQTTLGAKLTQKKVNVKSGATLKANADNIDAPVANNGTYDVTGGTIGKDVTGGKLNVKGDVTVGDNADVSTKSANVAKGASLDVGTNSVDLGDATIDGTVKLEITDITASSNKYTGGQINAKSLNLGKDSKLSLTIAPNLIAKKTSTGALDIINVSGATTGQFAEMLSNNRYMLASTSDGKFVITNYASVADIINEAGGSTNNVAAGETWDELTPEAGSKTAEVQNVLNDLSQHNEKGYIKALTDLAPTDSLVHVGVTQDFNNLIGEQIAARLNREGLNSGDTFAKRGAWVQMLYNHSKQDDTYKNQGFTGKTAGVAFGLDGEVDDKLTVGVGYAYGKTDVDSGGRDIDIDGHTLYIYGKYQPSTWYIRGLAHYGFAKYEEKANIAGIANKAKYDVHNFGARAFVGYDLPNGFTPEAGLRITRIDRRNYTDSFGQHVKSDGIDILTASMGVNYSTTVTTKDQKWAPKAHVALTYDILSDDSNATVNVGNGVYNIEGKKLNRFGAEAGIGAEISVGNWDFSAEYDLGVRKDYLSHTGMLKAKYNF